MTSGMLLLCLTKLRYAIAGIVSARRYGDLEIAAKAYAYAVIFYLSDDFESFYQQVKDLGKGDLTAWNTRMDHVAKLIADGSFDRYLQVSRDFERNLKGGSVTIESIKPLNISAKSMEILAKGLRHFLSQEISLDEALLEGDAFKIIFLAQLVCLDTFEETCREMERLSGSSKRAQALIGAFLFDIGVEEATLGG